jgi:hypothetical protein
MQGMTRQDHKPKRSKRERDQQRQLYHMETGGQTNETNEEQAQKQQKHRKYSRLDHSPITVSGTPDIQSTQKFQHARFSVPDFSHRDQSYHQPPLSDRLLIDDLLSEEWDKGLGGKVLSHHRTLTQNDFDFSDEGLQI